MVIVVLKHVRSGINKWLLVPTQKCNLCTVCSMLSDTSSLLWLLKFATAFLTHKFHASESFLKNYQFLGKEIPLMLW